LSGLQADPALYQANTRVWLRRLADRLGRPATLGDVPDKELDRLARLGFDWVYLLGVWQTSPLGREIALQLPEALAEYQAALPDFKPADVCGSCFAITGYMVSPELGGDAALSRFRQRLNSLGMRLMLDFIPNHTGRDHPWVLSRPEFYVTGSPEDLAREPENFGEVPGGKGILAFGRDPYFSGWRDTFQLNYGNPDLQEAMIAELLKIARLCDGVRCDVAMLVLPQVFQRTWGIQAQPFWPRAIEAVRASFPEFTFLAEVYWDLEWTLQQEGFDYTYDKRLYDRLRAWQPRQVREHFFASLDYQKKLVRFLENHDEPRAAATFLSPGLKFFHQGQLEGARVRLPVQLCRAPVEPLDPVLADFYERLLQVMKRPVFRCGRWQLLEPLQAWTGNLTYDCFIAFGWSGAAGEKLLVAVNYSPEQGQCYLRLPFPELEGRRIRLADQLGDVVYERSGKDLMESGLYLDLPPWGVHVFELSVME
jgi:hypothetical protein